EVTVGESEREANILAQSVISRAVNLAITIDQKLEVGNRDTIVTGGETGRRVREQRKGAGPGHDGHCRTNYEQTKQGTSTHLSPPCWRRVAHSDPGGLIQVLEDAPIVRAAPGLDT